MTLPSPNPPAAQPPSRRAELEQLVERLAEALAPGNGPRLVQTRGLDLLGDAAEELARRRVLLGLVSERATKLLDELVQLRRLVAAQAELEGADLCHEVDRLRRLVAAHQARMRDAHAAALSGLGGRDPHSREVTGSKDVAVRHLGHVCGVLQGGL